MNIQRAMEVLPCIMNFGWHKESAEAWQTLQDFVLAQPFGYAQGPQTTNTQSDEIIAGIVTYINGRLADKHCEYTERQWLYNIRYLCGNLKFPA